MIKKRVEGIIVGILIGVCTIGYGQRTTERKADKVYQIQAYVNAIKIYEKLANKGYMNAEMLKKLANSYYFNGKLTEANHWYGVFFDGSYEDKGKAVIASEYYYRYAQTLRSVEDYAKADQMMETFALLEKEDSRARLFKKNKDNYLHEIEQNSNRYELENLSINSPYSDFGAAIWKNYFVYTSARETKGKSGKRLHDWTNESYTSLYRARINYDGTLEEPHLLLPTLRGIVNEATAVFTSDAKTMYFTRNNVKGNGKKVVNKEGSVLLKIYSAVLSQDNTWVNITELPFNSDLFSTANPALTPDDKWLYFSSDREGTMGQSDIFRVPILEDGGFGEVENLGSKVNTEGRETFPFISKDNILFFSSDGHPGLGGLDVFAVQLYEDGTLGEVKNVGAPINSSADDFSFYLDTDSNTGYVSSNRANGVGGDDVYSFKEKICHQYIEGYVLDKDTGEVLPQAKIVISDHAFVEVAQGMSNEKGYYRVEGLLCKEKYRIKAEIEEYNTEELTVELDDQLQGSKVVDIVLEKTEKPLAKEDDLFKVLNLRPIYFDFDQVSIRTEEALELRKVIEVMELYPSMKIEVRAHTDSRGNAAYNLKLSDRRAKATVNWIIDHGIEGGKISGQGYGATQLQNHCSPGVSCTDEEHQLNRRSEFIILEL
ncbi:OmpA family protein [Myroides odoratimimus]|uniref:OmpA family protein n=1 Tax=Myroides odoratimimus TaxID=76832 RepID=UPI002576E538|nr:OmpA family protein [Myroides odoratimimus]MDM1499538.1 OmpA family protein [Myroides odoratimimus]